MRNEQVIRVLGILYRMLTCKLGVSVPQLAEEFNVHPKTIRRDLAAIEHSHFPLFEENHAGVRRFKINREMFF